MFMNALVPVELDQGGLQFSAFCRVSYKSVAVWFAWLHLCQGHRGHRGHSIRATPHLAYPAHSNRPCAGLLLNRAGHGGSPDVGEGCIPVVPAWPCMCDSSVQVTFIKQRLRSDLRKPAAASLVEVATIDAFQGREADVVLLSCVRAPWHGGSGSSSGASGVGFLQDVRRMNVGLTRARRSLWVVGHVESLVSSRPWRSLIEHAGASLMMSSSILLLMLENC